MANERGRTCGFRRIISCLSRSASPEPAEPARQVLGPQASGTPVSSTVSSTRPSASSSSVTLTTPIPGGRPSSVAIPPPQPALLHPSARSGGALAAVRPATPTGAPTVAAVPLAPNPADEIFQEALKGHEQRLSPAQRQAFLNASATGLISIIEGLNDQHQKESVVRNAAVKVQEFLTVVDRYLTVAGICIQHNPDICALVVGGLKLFVDIGRRYAGFFDKLSETMKTLAENLCYLARYERLYRDNMDFRAALCEAYGDLIIFCETVCGIFMDEDGTLSSRVSAQVFLKQLYSPIESRLDALNTSFIEHIRKVERMGHILRLEKDDWKERLDALEKADQARGNLLSWLSTLEPETDLERICAKRHGNTGTWFLESAHVKNWLEADSHQLLWCYGSPGVGKSVLLSILVEEISSKHLFDNRIGIAFFYFNFQNEASTQSEASFLSILLKQLCRRQTDFPNSLIALHKESCRNHKLPSIAQLKRQLEEIAMTFDQVFLMVDALDECLISQRQKFLQYIKSLLGLRSGKLKIFVTSRPERDIELEFTSAGLPVIQIEATKVAGDIASYVSHELSHRIHPYFNLKDCRELRMEIEGVLLSKSNGMFLWVTCQLAHIYQQPSKEHVKRSLESLPDDMAGTYGRILETIHRKPEAMRVIAKRALIWVLTAKRPLTLGELALAIAIESTSNSLNDLAICGPQVAIDACGGLLISEADEVRPIHFTVKEYLQSGVKGVCSTESCNAEVARSSLRFILFPDFDYEKDWSWADGGGMVPQIESFDKMNYIWGFWNRHVQCLSSPLPDDVENLLRRLFGGTNLKTVYMTRARSSEYDQSVLGLCAIMDLLPIYSELYPSDWLNLSSLDLREAMRNAARGGSISAVKTLCSLMDEEDTRDGEWIKLAGDAGHVAVVMLFLELGADINTSLVLQTAARAGSIAVVELLIENGANLNNQGGEYGTALQAAARYGHESIVDTLLANGADVNIQGGEYGTALQAAIVGGIKSIIDTLLANGADVNIQSGKYGTALLVATQYGYESIVNSLLANGADVNIQYGQHGTALHAAASYGRRSIVDTLLASGADVNIQGGKYGTALQAAAARGDRPTIGTLLANGADVNIQGGKFGTALQAAAKYGDEPTIDTLLANGADVNIQGGKFGTALQAAAVYGHESIVNTLLANGADVNIQGRIVEPSPLLLG